MDLHPPIEPQPSSGETWFHEKIRAACDIRGDGHWVARGSLGIRLPGGGRRATTIRRAARAAFVDDVPEWVELRSCCGVSACLRPDHQVEHQSSTIAFFLSLREFRDARDGKISEVPPDTRAREKAARAAATVAKSVGVVKPVSAAELARAAAEKRWQEYVEVLEEKRRKDAEVSEEKRRRAGAKIVEFLDALCLQEVRRPCRRPTDEERAWLEAMGCDVPA